VRWRLGDGARLGLVANIADAPTAVPAPTEPLLFESAEGLADALAQGAPLDGWSALWTLGRA
jgi:hypothetical protein